MALRARAAKPRREACQSARDRSGPGRDRIRDGKDDFGSPTESCLAAGIQLRGHEELVGAAVTLAQAPTSKAYARPSIPARNPRPDASNSANARPGSRRIRTRSTRFRALRGRLASSRRGHPFSTKGSTSVLSVRFLVDGYQNGRSLS